MSLEGAFEVFDRFDFDLDQQQLLELQQQLDQQEQQLLQSQQPVQPSSVLQQQQQQQLQDDIQLKPGLMQLLQQMQHTHDTAAQHTAGLATQYNTRSSSSSGTDTAVASGRSQRQQQPQQPQQQQRSDVSDAGQLTQALTRVSSPHQLLGLLLSCEGGLTPVHLTAAGRSLLRLAKQQEMGTDQAYTRKVGGCQQERYSMLQASC